MEANAVVYPGAVMVHPQYTSAAKNSQHEIDADAALVLACGYAVMHICAEAAAHTDLEDFMMIMTRKPMQG